MALPSLPCLLDWLMYDGIFFTRQRPLFLWPISPLTACPSLSTQLSWSSFGLRGWSHFLLGQMSPGRVERPVPRSFSCPSTHGAAGMNLSFGNKALT